MYKDIPQKALLHLSEFQKWSRQWTYVNCWHMNNYESAAMWKLYTQSAEAVAIQSTYQQLKTNLPKNVYLGKVNYIDYEKDWMPEGNLFWPYVHKRKSFEHENEIRAVIQEIPFDDDKIAIGKENLEKGLPIAINPEQLVENLYISPSAPDWFRKLVTDVTQKYEYKFNIQQSILTKKPLY